MTARIVVCCDGTLPSGMPCRGALPTREADADLARAVARSLGWTTAPVYDDDHCPSCSRREPAP